HSINGATATLACLRHRAASPLVSKVKPASQPKNGVERCNGGGAYGETCGPLDGARRMVMPASTESERMGERRCRRLRFLTCLRGLLRRAPARLIALRKYLAFGRLSIRSLDVEDVRCCTLALLASCCRWPVTNASRHR